ncbi:hypothetical protein RRG08_017003 [Elysia crispata]|uniref:Uncharacterized protein n=1 Tax=Elysia crispata TaxID=231223 RepID=A0AAE1CPK3_9GAST|nr:hypothetical protein RRG08_017003 [Elysia crispata]
MHIFHREEFSVLCTGMHAAKEALDEVYVSTRADNEEFFRVKTTEILKGDEAPRATERRRYSDSPWLSTVPELQLWANTGSNKANNYLKRAIVELSMSQ